MDTINPWLDPSEVRHLAEQLLRPVAPARINAADPGFNDAFVGFTSPNQEGTDQEPFPGAPTPQPPAIPTTQPEPSLSNETIRQPEEIAGTSPQETEPAPPPSEPAPLPEVPSKTRFLERIQIFRDWLIKNFKASEIFILDREGKVIFDESGHGRLHFMARNLASASKGPGNIHVKIGPSSILEVLPCDTPYGRIVLGTLVPEALPPHHVQTITQVLIQTASPV